MISLWSFAACGSRPPTDAPPDDHAASDSPALAQCTGWNHTTPCRTRIQSFVDSHIFAVRGDDNRMDPHCLDDPDAGVPDVGGVKQSVSRVAALFPRYPLLLIDGRYRPDSKVLPLGKLPGGEALCPDEVFASQPRGAECSAVLVGPHTVLTSEHCVTKPPYKNLQIAFGFEVSADGSIAVDPVDICKPATNPRPTYHTAAQLVLFDIECPLGFKRTPTPIAKLSAPTTAGMVYAIGFPKSLPAKFSGWAHASAHDPPGHHKTCKNPKTTFHAALDVAPGNSGSPVFNATHELVGIAEEDKSTDTCVDPNRTCRHWASVPTTSHEYVTITSTHEITAALQTRTP